MSDVDALPCPFCGRPPMVFKYNGTRHAQCQGAYGDCSGNHVITPLAMWNKRALDSASYKRGLKDGREQAAAVAGAMLGDKEAVA